MGNSIDYSKYKMNGRELLTGFIIGFGISFLYINMIFHKILFAAVAASIVGIMFLTAYKKKCIKKRDDMIIKQFKDLMESLVSSYSSGGNHVTAFETAYTDMVELYGCEGIIARELEQINTGMQNGMTMEALLKDFARRVGNEDISNFVDVFIVCIRHGGDMRKVLYDTRITIMEKLEMEEEIAVSLRASNNEFVILTIIPIIVDLFMQMDPSMRAAGQSAIGLIARLTAAIMCAIAYKLGRRIIQRVEGLFD